MRSKKRYAAVAAALSLAMLTGCSTTIGSTSSTYTTEMSRAISTWASSAGTSTSSSSSESTSEETAEADDGKTTLASPANWTVSEDGSYSFDAVDGADYYIIYLYDTASESTSFAYMSSNIEEDGSGTYSGALSDLFDYCFGLYNAEVIAYPAVGDDEYKKSAASECDFTVTGEVIEPEIAYLWDCFTGTLGVELINFESYQASAFPTLVEVTFTNEADSSDVITLSFENISIEDDVYGASTQEVTVDATYSISASVTWDDSVVTNPSITVDLGTVETASNKNAMTDGYGYINTDVYLSMDYPMVVTDFDPEEGGSAGTWYFFITAFTTNKGVAIPTTFIDCLNYQGEAGSMGADYHDGEDVEFTVTPVETTEGSAYSYSLVVSGPRDVISMFDGFFYNDMPNGEGTLELYEDGTFLMVIGVEEEEEEETSAWGPGGIDDSQISGLWVDNGDGTLTLSYDHTSAVLN